MQKTVKIQIGPFEKECALYMTMAPRSYDYDTSLFILSDIEVRYLFISLDAIEAQMTRYASGNYIATVCDNEHIIKYVCDKLVSKLFRTEY